MAAPNDNNKHSNKLGPDEGPKLTDVPEFCSHCTTVTSFSGCYKPWFAVHNGKMTDNTTLSAKWEKVLERAVDELGFGFYFHALTTLGPETIVSVRGDDAIRIHHKPCSSGTITDNTYYRFRQCRIGCAAVGVVDGTTKKLFISGYLFDLSSGSTLATRAMVDNLLMRTVFCLQLLLLLFMIWF